MNTFQEQMIHIENILDLLTPCIKHEDKSSDAYKKLSADMDAYALKHCADDNFDIAVQILRTAFREFKNDKKAYSLRNFRKIADALNQPISAENKMVH